MLSQQWLVNWVGQEFHFRVDFVARNPAGDVENPCGYAGNAGRALKCVWWRVACDYADLT